MDQSTRIAKRHQQLMVRLEEKAMEAERSPSAIKLLAVSKKQSPATLIAAHAAGLSHFGENYVQEALPKIEALTTLPITWHFIGPIQSNKTASIAQHFDWVHSVDRLKIALRLSRASQHRHLPLNICLQVNIDDEPTKSGVSLNALPELAKAIVVLPHIKLRGLMTMPKPCAHEKTRRHPFARLRDASVALAKAGVMLDTLSMGTSQDYDAAILEGATWIRVGEALFGHRHS